MRASEILGSRLVTESGRRIGHVYDIRVKRDPRSAGDRADQQWRIDTLVYGSRGMVDRFGVLAVKELVSRDRGDVLPWSEVIRIEPGRIVVRDP